MLIWLMFTHWVGDFLLQTSWMAVEKSRSFLALTAHVATYGVVLLVFSLCITSPAIALQFVGWNVLLHFITDTITSRITSYFRKAENERAFFCTIGLDQWIHFTCLYVTAQKFLL